MAKLNPQHQGHQRPPSQERNLQILLPTRDLRKYSPTNEPVSYTHLDVYKRQVISLNSGDCVSKPMIAKNNKIDAQIEMPIAK